MPEGYEPWAQCLGFGVSGLLGFGFRVQGLGIMWVKGPGFRVWVKGSDESLCRVRYPSSFRRTALDPREFFR